MKSSHKNLLALGLSALMLIALSIPAFAASADSSFITKTCAADSCTYTAMTAVYVDPESGTTGSDVGAIVQIYSSDYDDGKDVPAGYMGGEPRMYLDGELWLAQGWSYNTGRGNAFSTSYETYFVSRQGIVYAQSKFGLYNGDGYDIYTTTRSPSLDVSNIYPSTRSVEKIVPEYGINKNGQSYGSGCFDASPDLIKAIGANDVHGYVYDSQLTSIGQKASPDDVVEATPSSIPLYDKDGTTIIGEFMLGNPQ